MARTTFSGPVKSDNGFEGNITGNITGNVTGTLSGTVIQPVAAVTAVGTTIANAAALSAGVNIVSGADGTKSVVLPTAVAGATIQVYNTAATNGLPVLANTSDTINGGASVTMEGSTWLVATAVNSAAWLTTIFTADS